LIGKVSVAVAAAEAVPGRGLVPVVRRPDRVPLELDDVLVASPLIVQFEPVD